jgi:4-hydroxybenzoate polyprenyltransferase/phosphoserine phosphatase
MQSIRMNDFFLPRGASILELWLPAITFHLAKGRLLSDIPIVVDLDGTLLKSDLLYESATRYLQRSPASWTRMITWTLQGKAVVKSRLAEAVELDVARLPYREDVLEWLHEQRANGTTLVLATASNQKYAERIAEHLGIFDAVMGSDDVRNLGSHIKADALVLRYGAQGYDYMADRVIDLPIWAQSRTAHIVGGSPRLHARVAARTSVGQSFAGDPDRLRYFFKALRPHQWAKNVLVFIPLLLAHQAMNPAAVLSAILAFVAFSLAASGVYVLNDLADLDADRAHHRKSARPFASGRLSIRVGWVLWPLLIAASLALGFITLPIGFGIALSFYNALTFAYSFALKSRAVIDVITLSLLYTTRLVAGALAIEVAPTFWLLAFSIFFFLSLALMKRYNDVIASRKKGNAGAISGRGYVHSDAEPVTSIGVAAGMVSVLIMALYINDPAVADRYATPYALWPLVPLLLYWLARVWLLVHRGVVHDDPVFFALRDRASLAVCVLGVAIFAVASVISI